MFFNDMRKVANDLLSQFGATGNIMIPISKPDPITGNGDTIWDKEAVLYFREYFTGRELSGSVLGGQITADRIEAGDAEAIVTFSRMIENDWAFEDADGIVWNILSVQPVETQNEDVIYTLHIRK